MNQHIRFKNGFRRDLNVIRTERPFGMSNGFLEPIAVSAKDEIHVLRSFMTILLSIFLP
jgi:hypothetical protein